MIQALKFNDAFGEGEIWLIPEEISYMRTGEKTKEGKVIKFTTVHLKTKDKPIYITEHPGEVNKIFEKFGKRKKVIEYQ